MVVSVPLTPHVIIALLTIIPSLINANAITLTTWQPISGFSTACDNAYNTPLNGCEPSDFASRDCSMTCIAFLDALTKVLNADCTGTSAYPDTLIAAFFDGKGTQTLCPNVLSGGGSGSGSGQSAGSAATTSAAATSAAGILGHQGNEASAAPSYTSYSSIAEKLIFTTIVTPTHSATSVISSAASSSSTADSAATTTKVTFAETTVVPESTQPSSTLTNPSATSTKSTSTPTSTSGSNGGGGGTILDVGSSSSSHSMRIESWVLPLLTGFAGLFGILSIL